MRSFCLSQNCPEGRNGFGPSRNHSYFVGEVVVCHINSRITYPWGGELQFTNNDSNHYKLTGKERDSETGLDYFGARHYSNALGRFITADWTPKASSVPYADFADPQSLNLYTYVRNIPTTREDPDGHSSEFWQKVWNGIKGDGFNTDAQVKENDRLAHEDYQKNKAEWEKRHPGQSYSKHKLSMILRTLDFAPIAGFSVPEQAIADLPAAEGKTVTSVVASNTAKSADALVNGVATEFKTLTNAGPNTLKNAIQAAAKQGKNIVVDARNVPISKANAAAQIARAQGNIGGLEGRVTVITSEGKVSF